MHIDLTSNLFWAQDIKRFLREDGLDENLFYLKSLPQDLCKFELKIKSDVVLSGVPFFKEVFIQLGANPEVFSNLEKLEGTKISSHEEKEELKLELPFGPSLVAERLALNCLQRSTAISTITSKFVEICKPKGVAVLDTRKTTPGLKHLEKYAVRVGGGKNHRLNQTQMWMIKDNHKYFWKGITNSKKFFDELGQFYQVYIVEIHSIPELVEAQQLGLDHMLLDNFSEEMLKEALTLKKPGNTFEVSGGINLDNVFSFLQPGVDAISIGSITQFPPTVDLSFKLIEKVGLS